MTFKLPPLPTILDIHINTRNAARAYALAAIAPIAAENAKLLEALRHMKDNAGVPEIVWKTARAAIDAAMQKETP